MNCPICEPGRPCRAHYPVDSPRDAIQLQIDYRLPAARLVHRDDPETSLAAGESMVKPLIGLRKQAHTVVVESGTHGCTKDDVNRALGWIDAQGSRRLLELRLLGHVVRTKRSRKTRTGRMARVYVVRSNLLPTDEID